MTTENCPPYTRSADSYINNHLRTNLLWKLVIKLYNTPKHAYNLFNTRIYGDQSAEVDSLRAHLNSVLRGGILTLYLYRRDPRPYVDRLFTAFTKENNNNPLAKWYMLRSKTLQLSQLPQPVNRPSYNLPRKWSFHGAVKYKTILSIGTIRKIKIYQQLADRLPDKSLKLQIITISGAGKRRYLSFLDILLEIGDRLQLNNGDTLRICFNQEADIHKDNWAAKITPPLPFTPLGFITIILTRP